jgi:hypothetical protein
VKRLMPFVEVGENENTIGCHKRDCKVVRNDKKAETATILSSKGHGIAA